MADALASGASERKLVQVQVLFLAPNPENPNLLPIVKIGEGFGFVLFVDSNTISE